jgi:hypothetical protein
MRGVITSIQDVGANLVFARKWQGISPAILKISGRAGFQPAMAQA